MTGRSPSFERFVASFAVTDRESSEDYDLDALMQLEVSERTEAEDLLIQVVEAGEDPRAPKALRYLGVTRALPALRAALNTAQDQMLVQCALAVRALGGDDAVAGAAIVRALRIGTPYARVDAAAALRDIATPEAVEALYEAVGDPDKLVRANAVDSLFAVSGLAEWDTVAGRGVGLLGLKLRSRFASVRRDALVEFRRIAEAKRAGATAADLGIPTEAVERSEAAVRAQQSLISKPGSGPWAHDFDLEALGALRDGEREWAVASLLLLLERGDPRAARALGAMGAPEAVEPLREVAAGPPGELADAAASALAN